MGGFIKKTLESGKDVTLVSWEDENPTSHSVKVQEKAWNAANSREGLAFYDATVNYMRNDWAEKHMHMAVGTVDTQKVALFFHEKTNSWHSADALDIDHVKPWKDHLKERGVAYMDEAHMAYNDVSNLRLLPSAYNRARDSADKVFDTHGDGSVQAQKWSSDRFGFDPSATPPAYDPDKDAARRTKVTVEQLWTDDNQRSELSFDKKVDGKWFDARLKEIYASSVTVDNPNDHSKQSVPLFRCEASHQLVTRDALDIDHILPFETLVDTMKRDAQQKGYALTKEHVLDAYNNVDNLRLVSRSANSAHEWELTKQGEWRDAEKEKPEKSREFSKFIDDSGAMDVQTRKELDGALQSMKDGQRNRHAHMDETMREHEAFGTGSPPLLKDVRHPAHEDYLKAMGGVDLLDPKHERWKDPTVRENVASSLVVAAALKELPRIDTVAMSKDGATLFAVHGDATKGGIASAWVKTDVAEQRTMQQNTIDTNVYGASLIAQAPSKTPHHGFT